MKTGNVGAYIGISLFWLSLSLAVTFSDESTSQTNTPDTIPQQKREPRTTDKNSILPSQHSGENPPQTQRPNSNKNQSEPPNERPDCLFCWKSKFWHDTGAQWSMAIFGALATALSGIGIVLLWRTLRATSGAVRETARASDAAERSATLAEQGMVALQRALVVPTRFRCDKILRYDDVIGYRVSLNLLNTGKSAAKQFRAQGNFVIFGEGLPRDFSYSDRHPHNPTRFALGPGVEVPIPIDISIYDIQNIKNGTHIGLIYVWANYDDIFPNTPHRRTEFCFEVIVLSDPVAPVEPGDPSPIGFRAFGNYNGIDEDCRYGDEGPPVEELPPATPFPAP